MSKKILSVVLALALALSCFAISAFAIGETAYESAEDAAKYTQTWTLGDPVDIGNGQITVDVILDANYDVGPIEFRVIKTVSAGTIKLVDFVEGKDIPANWIPEVGFQLADEENGVLESDKFTVIPYPTNSVDALNCEGGKVVATITYAVSDDAAGTLAILVSDDKSEENPDGTLIAARMDNGNVVTGTALVGQTVTATTNTVTIGNAVVATPELVGKEATHNGITSTGFVDTVNGYVYGVVVDANPLSFFEATNGGYIEMTANNDGYTNGTGAVLTLYKDNSKAEVVATYELVIFGDVNGDGAVNITDSGEVDLTANYAGSITGIYVFAADVNGDGAVNITDSGDVDLAANYALTLPTNPFVTE